MERTATLRRLDKFRRSQPYITARALAAVLKDVAGNSIPELHGRDHMYQAAVELMNEATPHGRLVTPIKLVEQMVVNSKPMLLTRSRVCSMP